MDYLPKLPDACVLSERNASIVKELEENFHLGEQDLQDIAKQFAWEFNKGLSEPVTPANKDTFLPMIPTFITSVPNGTEVGQFLALDLGGTNLRVCQVDLKGSSQFDIKQKKYKVSEELKSAEIHDLFDFIAECVDAFLEENNIKPAETLHLGFTFSFPVQQTALDKGKLISWTKGFKARHAIGHDVVKILQESIDRKKLPVKCSALVNDTVGTMLSQSYRTGSCLAGIIFGTGTNACYLEALPLITKMKAVQNNEIASKGIKNMIVNTEWGAFDNERRMLHVTRYDNKVDRESINPRKQAFEKMISGMYLGEIVRNVLIDLIDRLVLFGGHSTSQLNEHYGFDTELMSQIEDSEDENGHTKIEQIRRVLESLGVKTDDVSDEEYVIVKRVCQIVGTRAARLSAVAITAILQQTVLSKENSKYHQTQSKPGEYDISLGVDGSLAEYYPHFEARMRDALRLLVGPNVEKQIKIGLAKDGSGVGAALCALQAKKQSEAGHHLEE